jgi:predicted enzyme related to lactoylglutathione lyase
MASSRIGTIGWTDLTVPDADNVRAFYENVVGLRSRPHDLGEYVDFDMLPAEGSDPVTGICHARGTNADVPPVWLVYFVVTDAEASAARCVEHGDRVIVAPRDMGGARFAITRDPAGAVCALYQEPTG